MLSLCLLPFLPSSWLAVAVAVAAHTGKEGEEREGGGGGRDQLNRTGVRWWRLRPGAGGREGGQGKERKRDLSLPLRGFEPTFPLFLPFLCVQQQQQEESGVRRGGEGETSKQSVCKGGRESGRRKRGGGRRGNIAPPPPPPLPPFLAFSSRC